MELRYLGFEQQKNARVYRFDVVEKGQPVRHFVVTADLALFLQHHVGIQEGPALCALKLTANLELCPDGAHQLTSDDLRSHAAARSAAEAHRAETRRSGRRRPAPGANAATGSPGGSPIERSPWRNLTV
jgi:hypothetical protein